MVKIKEGEIICNRCNGSGDDPEYTGEKNGFTMDCQKCRGLGKVNWIENVFGKEIRLMNFDYEVPSFNLDIIFLDYDDKIKPNLTNT